MTTLRKLTPVMLAATMLAGAAGCSVSAGPTSPADPANAPHVVALSTYEASVGTLIEAYGSHFIMPGDGKLFLVFEGTFESDLGGTEPVSEEFQVRAVNRGTLVWDSFGPFRVPFGSAGNETGVFRGTVAARSEIGTTESGIVTLDDPTPTPIAFRVRPSILVREFQPTTASCAAPVERIIGGAPYRIRVEAVGFEPRSFTYAFDAPGMDEIQTIRLRHVANGRFDAVGDNNNFVLPAVPVDRKSYGAVLSVQATATDGRTYSNIFGMGVHRPIEIFYNGNVQVAELEAPVPVSGCIAGGVNGRHATYNEAQTDVRQRSFEVNWNESWLEQHRVADANSGTRGQNEVNGIGFATTDENLFRWELGGSTQGTAGFNALAKLELQQNVNYGTAGQNRTEQENSRDRQVGINESETTTHTDEVTKGNQVDQGGGSALQISSEETIQRDFGGSVIAGTFGVFYRQPMRLIRRGAVVTYNQCGIAEVVADVDFTDWQWNADLALGNSCNPLPASNLPPAECVLEPCTGQ